jgi:eukaryotic-like serine/threonine-protein kinase
VTVAITDRHVLPQDLVIMPVTGLEAEVRARIECQDDDFAVTRPRSRAPAKIVDATAGELLKQFTQPRTIIDVLLEFSVAHGVEPEQLLADAFPMLQRFVDAGLLVEEGSKRAGRIVASLEVGDTVGSWEVVHCLQVLDDVELYQVRGSDRRIGALKITRNDDGRTKRMLERESAIISRLGGAPAPQLLESGIHSGCSYLVLEWRQGVNAETVANELRASSAREDRLALLHLCRDIAGAYGELHACGVLHGDVHDRNLLIDGAGAVTILDFGLSRPIREDLGRRGPPRGGVGVYFEPEYAAARRDKHSAPPVTATAEQYSVAALLYTLFTGTTYLNFSLDHSEAMRQIAAEPPLSFAARSQAPFPELERVLGRALSKAPSDRFPSIAEFAEALTEVIHSTVAAFNVDTDRAHQIAPSQAILETTLRELRGGGALFRFGVTSAPTANVTFGSAGIACALYRMSLVRDDSTLLSLADIWATRAANSSGSRQAYYNKVMGLTRASIGSTSLYHTASGVHVVRALIARAMGDLASMNAVVAAFVASSRRGSAGYDLTLGRSGILLGCALLLEATPRGTLVETEPLVRLGDRLAGQIWRKMDTYPLVGEPSPSASLGIAHGWAGVLYATLRWRLATGAMIDASVESRLGQLADCSEPLGRGVRWPWIDNGRSKSRDNGYMSGWCNGSAGFVHLWLLAHSVFREPRFLALAYGAAWNAWEDEVDHSLDLCCGLAGRAYSLLAVYRDSGDREWLRRAIELNERANDFDEEDAALWAPTNTSLYKSGLGAALLTAELERPEAARMPLFEAEGWPAAR